MSNYGPTLPLTPPPTHEPSPPSSSGPTTYYLGVSSSLSFSSIVVIVRHRRHPCHHGVGCGLLLGAACRHCDPHHCRPLLPKTHQRRRPHRLALSSPPPAISPPIAVTPSLPSPPSRLPMESSWTSMRCQRPPVPTRRVPLLPAPLLSGDRPIAPMPPAAAMTRFLFGSRQ